MIDAGPARCSTNMRHQNVVRVAPPPYYPLCRREKNGHLGLLDVCVDAKNGLRVGNRGRYSGFGSYGEYGHWSLLETCMRHEQQHGAVPRDASSTGTKRVPHDGNGRPPS
jgi:hypothetical protein